MAENDKDFQCDNTMNDGTRNNDWCYALHLDINPCYDETDYNNYYMCIIERV